MKLSGGKHFESVIETNNFTRFKSRSLNSRAPEVMEQCFNDSEMGD